MAWLRAWGQTDFLGFKSQCWAMWCRKEGFDCMGLHAGLVSGMYGLSALGFKAVGLEGLQRYWFLRALRGRKALLGWLTQVLLMMSAAAPLGWPEDGPKTTNTTTPPKSHASSSLNHGPFWDPYITQSTPTNGPWVPSWRMGPGFRI